jgi:hypothetical protein
MTTVSVDTEGGDGVITPPHREPITPEQCTEAIALLMAKAAEHPAFDPIRFQMGLMQAIQGLAAEQPPEQPEQ